MVDWMTRGRQRTVSDLEIIKTIEGVMHESGDPCVTVKEVEPHLQIGRQQVNDRMEMMQQEGIVDYKKSGSGKVWWVNLSE